MLSPPPAHEPHTIVLAVDGKPWPSVPRGKRVVVVASRYARSPCVVSGDQSATTSARNVGSTAPPLAGAARTGVAGCVAKPAAATSAQVGAALSFSVRGNWLVQAPT